MPISKASVSAKKGHVTRALKTCEDIISQEDIDDLELQLAIQNLKTKWNNYEQLYDQYETQELESRSEEEFSREADCHNSFEQAATSQLSKYVHIHEQKRPPEQRDAVKLSRPKLPNLELIHFRGDILEWVPFWDSFRSLIDDRKDLDDVEKMTYLRSCLSGPPADLIIGYQTSRASYKEALSALKEKYADENKIKQHLCHLLLDLKPPSYNVSELTAYLNEYQSIIRNLKQYVNDVEGSNWFLQEILLRKLPSQVENLLFTKLCKHYFSVEEIEQGIKDSIQHLTTVKDKQIKHIPRTSKEEKPKQKSYHRPLKSTPAKGNNGSVPHTKHHENAVGSYSVESKGNKKIYHCLYCQGSHCTTECHKYATLQEKRDRLKELKRCTRCVSKNHDENNCDTILIMCRRCERGRHHTALCLKGGTSKPPSTTTSENETSQQTVVSVEMNKSKNSTALPTATVEILNRGTKKKLTTRAFFDQGSQCTFITKEVSDLLNLKVQKKISLAISGFLMSREQEEYEVVRPTVRLGDRYKKIEAVVLDHLPNSIFVSGLRDTAKMLQDSGICLADKHINEDRVENIDLIVGADYYGDFITSVTTKNQIHLAKSSGGYLIYGRIPGDGTNNNPAVQSAIVARMCTEISPVEVTSIIEEETAPLHKLWDLDVIGINANQPSPEDNTSYNTYLDTVKYDGEQYWVRLPWKLNSPTLPTNYSMALGQLKSLTKTLNARNDFNTYHELILTQLENGFIEKVSNPNHFGNCHYLPHHTVKKDSVTTPMRMVFNCSAKQGNSPSLNDCLMTGPSLTEKLGDVLLRFRTNSYVYSADISKAFLRVGLQECDRDFTRFLWYENPEDNKSQLVTFRFKSVLFGATCSPFLLQATLDSHMRNSHSEYKDIISKNFYVDNFLGTTSSKEELLNIYHNANYELMLANMPLRMWTSNDSTLNRIIELDYPDYEVPYSTKVLGLQWDVRDDTINVAPLAFADLGSLSKRRLLSLVSSAFDPLGLVSPITMKGKLLVREAWKLKIGWDEELPPSFNLDWLTLADEFVKLNEIKVPRMVAKCDENYKLHIFCDASSLGYGAAAYLVTEHSSNLVTSKARVAPLKTRSLPQLELTALQVGARVARHLNETISVPITDIVIWSDNEAALQWLRNDKSSIPYVKNRVAAIREVAENYQFKHVPSKENPADLLSRGTSLKLLRDNYFWFRGPDWLCNPDCWPNQREEIVSVYTSVTDKKPTYLFDASNISSLRKILRITGYVFQFLNNTKPTLKFPDCLQYWINMVQQEYYKEEFNYLQTKDKSSSNTLSLIKNLGLYINQETNLIQCRGRLQHSSLDTTAKHPILLPRHSWLTTLLIRQHHDKCLHGGVADTLALIRERYWIPKGRQVIKGVLKACVICKTIEGRPHKLPGPPPLPEERVVHMEPFRTVGVDFSGSITVSKTEDGVVRKCHICLFTCATTRAVHLELAKDLTASTFIHLLRRFAARRSIPSLLISDNATNFTATANLLKDLYQDPMVTSHLKTNGIQWKFIPPRAPWMGGFYERLIGLVKTCIRKVLFRRKISEEELVTILTEVEMRVNNRPLTYIDDDIDHHIPLTPSHLIFGRRLSPMPVNHDEWDEICEDPNYIGKNELMNRYVYLSKILKCWEQVWKREYLTSLREKYYGAQAAAQAHQPKVGDVVLINCEGPRTSWPLGRITALHQDRDGIVRVAEVVSNGIRCKRTLEKLVPLEIHCPPEQTDEPQGIVTEPSISKRQRKAAERARAAIRGQMNSV